MITHIYQKHKSTIQNFLWRSIQIFGKQGSTFLIFILCAKLLTPYDFGIYNYLLAIVFFVIIFSDFGISLSTSKHIAEYSEKDPKKINTLIFNSLLSVLMLGVFISIAFLVGSYFFYYEYFSYIVILTPMIILSPLTSVYDGIYRGLRKFKKLSLITTIIGIISIIYIPMLVYSYGIYGALISQSIFYFILLIALYLGHKEIDVSLDRSLIKQVLWYSVFVGIANISYFLYTRVDIIFLGHYGYIEEIGYYEIINKLFQILELPVSILATVIAPTTTILVVKQQFKNIQSKFINGIILFLSLGVIIALGLYFIMPYIFEYGFGEYDQVLLFNIFFILLFTLPLKLLSAYVNIGYITPSGYVKILSITTLISGVINVILNQIFLSYFGFMGVIYATIIAQLIFMISSTLIFYFKLSKFKKNIKLYSNNIPQ